MFLVTDENMGLCLCMSLDFPVFYTVTTVSWSQKHVQNENIHSMINLTLVSRFTEM